MAERRQDACQAFADSARAAGKVYDQRAAPDDGRAAAEHRAVGVARRLGADCLGDARRIACSDGERCLGRTVARGKTGPARCDDKVSLASVGKPDQLRLDALLLIRQDQRFNDFIAGLLKQLNSRRAAFVDALARSALVAEGDDGGAQRRVGRRRDSCHLVGQRWSRRAARARTRPRAA